MNSRLINEYKKLKEIFALSDHISIKALKRDPPCKYQVTYKNIKGFEAPHKIRDFHTVIIEVDKDNYPKTKPECRIETPIFHPNIYENGIIDIGQWTVSLTLTDLISNICLMMQWQRMNLACRSRDDAADYAKIYKKEYPLGNVKIQTEKNEKGKLYV